MNKIEIIHCFFIHLALYSNCVIEKCPPETQTMRDMTMSKYFKEINRYIDAPAVVSVLLAIYGVALVTRTVAGVTIF
jgi:hypothetical protein